MDDMTWDDLKSRWMKGRNPFYCQFKNWDSLACFKQPEISVFFADFPFDDWIRWPHVSRWQATQADPSQPSGQKAVCEADNEEKMKNCAFDDMLRNQWFVPFVHGFFAESWRLYRRERKRHWWSWIPTTCCWLVEDPIHCCVHAVIPLIPCPTETL